MDLRHGDDEGAGLVLRILCHHIVGILADGGDHIGPGLRGGGHAELHRVAFHQAANSRSRRRQKLAGIGQFRVAPGQGSDGSGQDGVGNRIVRRYRVIGVVDRGRSRVGPSILGIAAGHGHISNVTLQQSLRGSGDLGGLSVIGALASTVPDQRDLLGLNGQPVLAGDVALYRRDHGGARAHDGHLAGGCIHRGHSAVRTAVGEALRGIALAGGIGERPVAVGLGDGAVLLEGDAAALDIRGDHIGILGGIVILAVHRGEGPDHELIGALAQSRGGIFRLIHDPQTGPCAVHHLIDDVVGSAQGGLPLEMDAVGGGGDGEVLRRHIVGHDVEGQSRLAVVGTVGVAHDPDGGGTHVHIVVPVGHVVAVGGLRLQHIAAAVGQGIGDGDGRTLGLAGVEAVLIGQLHVQSGDILALVAAGLIGEGIHVEYLTGANMVLIVEVALPPGPGQLIEGVAVLAPAAQIAVLPALGGIHGLGVVQQTVFPGVVDRILTHREHAGHQLARVEIDRTALPRWSGIGHIAGIGGGGDTVAAGAGQAGAAVPGIAVGVGAIALGLGEGVDLRHAAAGIIVSVNGQGAVRGGQGEVDGVVVVGSLYEVEALRVADGVALVAQAAADVVGDALVGAHHFAVPQRLRAGIGVVMAGEDHIDAGLLAGLGDRLLGTLSHSRCYIGVIRRLVGHQDLPGSTGGGGVFHQLIQVLLREAAESNCSNKYVAGFHGVVGAVILVVHDRVGIHRTDLMVADGKEPGHVQRLRHAKGAVPVCIGGTVVHQIAGLDGQIIFVEIQAVQNTGNVGVLPLLQVAQHQGVDAGVGIAGGKGLGLGPMGPVAYLIVVGGAGGKTGDLRAADISRAAVGEGNKVTVGILRFGGRKAHLTVGQPQLGGIGRIEGIGQPAHIQAVGGIRRIAPHMSRRAVGIALGRIDHGNVGG